MKEKPAEAGKERVIHESWFTLIRIVQDYTPFCDITLHCDHGHPMRIVKIEPDIRLDKPDTIPWAFLANDMLSKSVDTKTQEQT